MATRDPLRFPGYAATVGAVGSAESVVAGSARIGGIDVELAGFDFTYFGGSMGEVAGERLARAMERATNNGVPFVLRTATGGARMQEGMRSLVQMPKVVSARLGLAEARQPFIAVLGHPTTGGVLASLASLADVTVAEAGATIGFAGPRVAERFTGVALPEGSHKATSAYAAGLVDDVVTTADTHAYVASVLRATEPDAPIPVEAPARREDADDVGPWELVQLVRSAGHPRAPELVRSACDVVVELHGDRAGADDPAVFAAIGRVAGRRVVAIALDRDHHPGPAGFRKARRCLGIAARLRSPVVTVVDTRGADPSATSEAGGIAWEIARLFEAMLGVAVPVLSFVTGEGGSGGALAFASGDRLIAFGRSVFSVIGPEGAAEILWRDPARVEEATSALRLTAKDLLDLGIADDLIPGVATPEMLKNRIVHELDALAPSGTVVANRRQRWRSI